MSADRRKSGQTRAVGEVIPALLEKLGVFGGLRSDRVVRAWAEAAGPEVLVHTKAARLRGDTLVVEVDSAARLQELRNFTGEALRRRVNGILGEPLVGKILYRFASMDDGQSR